ncbi:glucose-6-phosphate isomerase, partial [Rhizina undulata]
MSRKVGFPGVCTPDIASTPRAPQASSRNHVLKGLFVKDAESYQKYSKHFESIFPEETFTLLLKLAKEAGVEKLRDAMFS